MVTHREHRSAWCPSRLPRVHSGNAERFLGSHYQRRLTGGKEGTANCSAHSASKAGVIALAKSVGKELAQTGVLVNAIAPAAVKTALPDQVSADRVHTMVGKSARARLGDVADAARLVVWVRSGSCTISTGAVIDLSGGRASY
jgi:2-dehydro-3-deoxy-L-rhamnonate dehydrogenase (NAD+)